MRIVRYLAAAALLAAAQPAAAERWFRVGGNADTIVYVDADSISIAGDTRYANTYHVYRGPISDYGAEPVFAGTIRYAIHCRDRYFRSLEYSYFGLYNAFLGTEPSSTPDQRRVPSPGSLMASIFRYVCDGVGGVAVDHAWLDAHNLFNRGGP